MDKTRIERIEEIKFRSTVLEGLMYLATDRGAGHLPSMWKFITSEIVGGAYEYILGREFQDTWVRFRGGMADDFWVDILNRRLNVLTGKKVQNRINLALAKAIRDWTHLNWNHDYGESWWDNQIRFWFMFGGHNHMQSTFALTVPRARKAEKELQNLDPGTLCQMEGIAEKMKKYIQSDLEYIRQHYHW